MCNKIEVRQGDKKGKFKIMVNHIQEGCELSSPLTANAMATKLLARFPNAQLFLMAIDEKKVTVPENKG